MSLWSGFSTTLVVELVVFSEGTANDSAKCTEAKNAMIVVFSLASPTLLRARLSRVIMEYILGDDYNLT